MAMSRIEIGEKLLEVMEMVVGSDSDKLKDCTEQTLLVDDLGLSSVGVLYVAIAIEEFFGVRFDGVGFGDFKTVGDVITFIEQQSN